MSRVRSFSIAGWALLIFLVLCTPHGTRAFELTVDGDRLSVSAERVPLRELLYRLSDFGVSVRIDPAMNPLVTASFEGKELEAGLKSILRPLNSVFIWRRDSAEKQRQDLPRYRLAAIQIFKPGEKDRMIDLDRDADKAAAQMPEVAGEDESGSETRVVIKGGRIFVPVVLGLDGQKVETTLLFDTGASTVVLHRNVADNLGLTDTIQAKGHGVGGVEIDARVSRLSSIQVGPYEKKDLRVAIVEYTGPHDVQYNGLLGMNFLWGLGYEIDYDRHLIRWGGGAAQSTRKRGRDRSQTLGSESSP